MAEYLELSHLLFSHVFPVRIYASKVVEGILRWTYQVGINVACWVFHFSKLCLHNNQFINILREL